VLLAALPAVGAEFKPTWKIPRGFREVVRERPSKLPELTEAEKGRGYLLFTRPEPGAIYRTSVPTRDECVDSLAVRVTPGEVADFNFALRPLRELPGTRVRVGRFGETDWPRDLRALHCWPQRTAWGSRCRTFHVVPEMMLKRETVDLKPGRTEQFYLRVHVPADAKPGTVRATVAVGESEPLALAITVLPFTLEDPPGIVFGLWPDRAAKLLDNTTPDVLRRIRRQGFNALIVYPLRLAKWEHKTGKVSADLAPLVTYMRLYRAAGFDARFVMSLQGIDGRVRKWVPNALKNATEYTPAAAGALRQVLALLRDAAKKHQWPSFVLHVVDEPHPTNTRMNVCIRIGKVTRAEGFDLFSTIWEPFAMDPYLKYRCYNCIHYISFPDAKTAARRREETRKAGDVMWFYGSGCYTDEHVIQDGNVIGNRYMSGNLAWRSGATGSWSWTFMRSRFNPYWDLDGVRHAAKDPATVYPPVPPDTGFTPTLQWEGLREGIDDYRYLHTLAMHVKRATASGDATLAKKAEEIDAASRKMIDTMPWKHTHRGRYPAAGITNERLNANRERIIDWILELRNSSPVLSHPRSSASIRGSLSSTD
jgi:hypothetical protein